MAFYRDWYTPERTVIVVTGDVQPTAIAASIERHFGGFTQAEAGAGGSGPCHAPAARAGRACWSATRLCRRSVSLNVVLPYDDRPDSLATQRDRLRELLAGAMLQRRLDSLGLQPGAPFSRAAAAAFDLAPAARIALVQPDRYPGDLARRRWPSASRSCAAP